LRESSPAQVMAQGILVPAAPRIHNFLMYFKCRYRLSAILDDVSESND